MKLHLILPFIGYLLRKMFSGVIRLNRTYRREMENHSGLAVFIGCICGLIFVIGTTLLGMLIIGDSPMLKYLFLSSIIGAVLYIVYTFFSVQFNDFLEERQKLFDIIKDR